MNTSLENKTILVVDDDADICEAVRSALEEAGGSVILADSVDSAFETYRQRPPHDSTKRSARIVFTVGMGTGREQFLARGRDVPAVRFEIEN